MKVGNDDLGTFLTGVKDSGTMAKSPEPTKKSSMNIFNPNKSVDHANTVQGGTNSPMGLSPRNSPGPQSLMMESFNFITSFPLKGFISLENDKAKKASARINTRASFHIEEELKRKLKEKDQKLKLEKILRNRSLHLDNNKKDFREKEQAKLERVQETLKLFKKNARKKQQETEEKMKKDDEERKYKIENASGARLHNIKKYMEMMKEKHQKVRDFQVRVASEEKEKLGSRLATVDEKIKSRRNKHDEFVGSRISSVKHRNTMRSDRLSSHRTSEHLNFENNFMTHQAKEKNNTVRLKAIYKDSYNQWMEFKDARRENYQINLQRQGDNSQAIKQRN